MIKNIWQLIAPGLLVAATGVGAGDLITAALAGRSGGLALLWTPILGALMKWSLNEGLTRWQLGTGQTLLGGLVNHFRPAVSFIFLPYFLMWTWFVGGALVSACGIGAHALLPLFGENLQLSRIVWGIFHSIIALILVERGSFSFFEKAMSVCIAIMFVSVLTSALFMLPSFHSIITAFQLAPLSMHTSNWSVGVLGGVGGTVTILSYGHWIRRHKRLGAQGLRISQWDLGISYFLTALFSLSMMIIGHRLGAFDANQENFPLLVGEKLAVLMGPFAKWIFCLGFWAGVFSSLLGVWQGVPYLFAEMVTYLRRPACEFSTEDLAEVDWEKSPYYRYLLRALTLLSPLALFLKIESIQIFYATSGAFFLPLLALALLKMNNSSKWLTPEWRNGKIINFILIMTLILFTALGVQSLFAGK